MKLVIDTSILISALLKKSVTGELLLYPFFEFLLPEYAIEELDAHKGMISIRINLKIKKLKRSGLNMEEIEIVLSMLMENITVIQASEIKPNLKKAYKIIGDRDPFDVPFVALALSIANDGVWSNDKHFENLRGVKVWKTSDLLKFIEKKSID